jgi:hypothetical protein
MKSNQDSLPTRTKIHPGSPAPLLFPATSVGLSATAMENHFHVVAA